MDGSGKEAVLVGNGGGRKVSLQKVNGGSRLVAKGRKVKGEGGAHTVLLVETDDGAAAVLGLLDGVAEDVRCIAGNQAADAS